MHSIRRPRSRSGTKVKNSLESRFLTNDEQVASVVRDKAELSDAPGDFSNARKPAREGKG